MRALVKPTPGPGLVLADVPLPAPGVNDVLIRITHAAICGTDLHIYNWDEWAARTLKPPLIVGHEFVGVVADVGAQVQHVKVGTRVVGEGHIVCGICRNCRAGAQHLCRNTIGVGIHRDGGFADYVCIPAHNAYAIPASLPDQVAAVLDPLGNAVHTALSFDLVGEDVLITGAGPIGQMASGICRHAGARHIVVTDLEPERLARAARMGATRVVNVGEESVRSVMADLGMTEGFDIALEMSGSPLAVDTIVDTINHGGEIGLLGLFAEPAELDLSMAILKGLTFKGVYGRKMFETWYKAVAMLESGLDITPVISHEMPLEEFDEAFALLRSGAASKIVLSLQ